MGRLIDADKLREEVLKWMPPEPCGQEEKEYPFETDIVASMMMTIEEAETVEAIPVDWLLRKADWCDKNRGIFVAGAIRSAVDAWREEQNNGADKS